jgi:hypothetical protein
MVAAGTIPDPCRVMAVGVYRRCGVGADSLPNSELIRRRRVVTLSEDRRGWGFPSTLTGSYAEQLPNGEP